MKRFFKNTTKSIVWVSLFFVFTISFFIYNEYIISNPSDIEFKTTSSKVYDNKGNLLYELSFDNAVRNSPVAFSKFPKNCTDAAVATEDKTFWTNNGVDRNGTIRLGINFLTLGKYGSGGSSITQQVIKIADLNIYGRNPKDKFREIAHAMKLNKEYSKEEILEMYLNNVYMGNLNYGFESASLDYFSKSVSDLSLSECAYLAGLIQSPSIYYPYGNYELGLKRQKTVLELMRKNNFISEAEYELAKSENLNITKKDFEIRAPHFVQFLQDELGIKSEKKTDYLNSNYEIDGQKSLEIYTYYDYDLHTKILEKLREAVKNNSEYNVNNVSAIALDKNGNLVTMIGSIDFFNDEIDGKFNSSLGLRQPGTLLIPLVYDFALEDGYPEDSTFENKTFFIDVLTGSEKNLEKVEVKNLDGFESDSVSLKTAKENNLVIPAVHILENNLENFENYLNKISLTNFPKEGSCNQILVLEGCELTLLDLTYIYSGQQNINVIKNVGFNIPQDITQANLSDFEIVKGENRHNKDLFFILKNTDYTIGIWMGNTQGEELGIDNDQIFELSELF